MPGSIVPGRDTCMDETCPQWKKREGAATKIEDSEARLCDVHADAEAYLLCIDGKLRSWKFSHAGSTVAKFDHHTVASFDPFTYEGTQFCVFDRGESGLCAAASFDKESDNLMMWSIDPGTIDPGTILSPGIKKSPPEGHTKCVRSFSVTRNGLQILSCSEDCTMRLWDTETHVELKKCWCEQMIAACVPFNDGTKALSVDSIGIVKVFDLDTEEELSYLRG
eukprot:COSAG06_NODE_22449_length_723_cov_0.806090_2_plen_221_part_01